MACVWKGMVAGDSNAPKVFRLPFRMELKAAALSAIS